MGNLCELYFNHKKIVVKPIYKMLFFMKQFLRQVIETVNNDCQSKYSNIKVFVQLTNFPIIDEVVELTRFI